MNDRESLIHDYNAQAPVLNLPTLPKNVRGYFPLYSMLGRCRPFLDDRTPVVAGKQVLAAQKAQLALTQLVELVGPGEDEANDSDFETINAALRDIGAKVELTPFTDLAAVKRLCEALHVIYRHDKERWQVRNKILWIAKMIRAMVTDSRFMP